METSMLGTVQKWYDDHEESMFYSVKQGAVMTFSLTFSPVWFLCGGGARVRGCEQVLELARGGAVSGQFSDIRLGSCFTRMAVRS